MSLLNEWQRPRGSSMPLICWRCDAPMKIKGITPAMSSAPRSPGQTTRRPLIR